MNHQPRNKKSPPQNRGDHENKNRSSKGIELKPERGVRGSNYEKKFDKGSYYNKGSYERYRSPKSGYDKGYPSDKGYDKGYPSDKGYDKGYDRRQYSENEYKAPGNIKGYTPHSSHHELPEPSENVPARWANLMNDDSSYSGQDIRSSYSSSSNKGNYRERNPQLESELFGTQMLQGIKFDKYSNIPVEVSGPSPPPPIDSFQETNFHPYLIENIEMASYSSLTPENKIKPKYKTKSFPTGLILAPTRELSIQIYKECCKFTYRTNIHTVCIYGGHNMADHIKALRGGADIVVATPGRLRDLFQKGMVSLSDVRYLVLDEGDRMLDMGFEPQIRMIVEEFDMTRDRQTLMFSATFPKEIQQLATDFLKHYIFFAIGRVGSTTENITQKVLNVEDHDKTNVLMRTLPTLDGLTLIFVETKRNAGYLEDFLLSEGIKAISIHGDKTQPEREEALACFRCGDCPVLVATDVAARGLDIPNVLYVINYDLPSNIDDYVHRIGRTGRCGNSGTALAFVNSGNKNVLKDLYELLLENKQEIPQWLDNMLGSYEPPNHGYGRWGRGRGGKFGGRDYRTFEKDFHNWNPHRRDFKDNKSEDMDSWGDERSPSHRGASRNTSIPIKKSASSNTRFNSHLNEKQHYDISISTRYSSIHSL